VRGSGAVYWRSLTIHIGNLLAGEQAGIEAIGDGVWQVHFGPVALGRFNERKGGERGYLNLKV